MDTTINQLEQDLANAAPEGSESVLEGVGAQRRSFPCGRVDGRRGREGAVLEHGGTPTSRLTRA